MGLIIKKLQIAGQVRLRQNGRSRDKLTREALKTPAALLSSVGKREDVQRIASSRIMEFRRDNGRHATRTAAAIARGHREVLFATRGERHGEALHRGRKPRLPQNAAG